MPFIILFIVIPFTELMVFAAVSDHIGLFTALMLAFLTAIVGGTIVKHQGLQTIVATRKAMDHGQMPVSELFDGFCLVAAGAMLITPGFITDAVGFTLLIPAFRNAVRHVIKTRTNWSMQGPMGDQSRQKQPHSPPSDPNVLEGEYEEID